MMSAIIFSTVFLGLSASLEIARLDRNRSDLQMMLDGALLACAAKYDAMQHPVSWMKCGEEQLRLSAGSLKEITVQSVTWEEIDEERIVASVSATNDGTLLDILDHDGVPVTVESTAIIRVTPKIEIALALDVSASMGTAPLKAMKDAAVAFVETIYDTVDPATEVTISVFPFADTVRFPAAYSDWIAHEFVPAGGVLGAAEWDADTLEDWSTFEDLAPTDAWSFYAEMADDWRCVNGRKTKSDRTGCRPRPTWDGCFRDPSDSQILSNALHNSGYEPQIPIAQYNKKGKFSMYYCPPQSSEAILFSRDRAHLTTMLAGMEKGYGTGTDIALSWAWRALSPGWRGRFKGANAATHPYDFGREVSKHIVLLTDGQPTGIARANEMRTNSAVANVDSLCKKIEAENTKKAYINIHTIAFKNKNGNVRDQVKDCAAALGAYHDAAEDDVEKVFKSIARSISRIAVRIAG